MTTDGDLLLDEFHEAGIWLPGEGLDTLEGQNERYPPEVNAKALRDAPAADQWNRYRQAMDGPCEAPWNLHPPSRPPWLIRQLRCHPEFCYWALWTAIIGTLLTWAWPW